MYRVTDTDGRTYGPVELEILRTWCVEGRISPDTQILDPIDEVLKSAFQIPEIAQYIRVAAPPIIPHLQPYALYPNYPFPAQLPQEYLIAKREPEPRVEPLGPPKSRFAALMLAILFGVFGVHRLYLGQIGPAMTMFTVTLLSCGFGLFVTVPWTVLDIILIASGNLRDDYGRLPVWP